MTDNNNNTDETLTDKLDLLLDELENQLEQGKLTILDDDENPTLLHTVIKEFDPLSDIDAKIRERIKKAIHTALQNKVDINVMDENSRTILHTAASNTSLKLFDFLWDKMADPTAQDNNENTPIALAIASTDDRIQVCYANLMENKIKLSNIFDKVDSQDFQNSLNRHYNRYVKTLTHIVILERDLNIIAQRSTDTDQYEYLFAELTKLIKFSQDLVAGHLHFAKTLSVLLIADFEFLEANIREEKLLVFLNSLTAIQPMLEALEVFPLKDIEKINTLRKNFIDLESIKLNFAINYFNFVFANLFACGLLPPSIKRKDEEVCEPLGPDKIKRCKFF